MRIFALMVLMAGCGDDGGNVQPDGGMPDAAVDASSNFFGEACDPGPDPRAIAGCRDNRGYCIRQPDNTGVCRPMCDQLHPDWNAVYVCIGERAGGTPTWTSDGNTTQAPYVCYCEPP